MSATSTPTSPRIPSSRTLSPSIQPPITSSTSLRKACSYGTIDECASNTKKLLNLWEKNENHTLCLNSAKAIGCTIINIGTQDLAEGRTPKPRYPLSSWLVISLVTTRRRLPCLPSRRLFLLSMCNTKYSRKHQRYDEQVGKE
ncbi:hypothetical protein ABZP36_017631 [Zizania latifolia]